MTSSLPSPPALHATPDAKRIFGLDALRAAAILSVVGAHALDVFYPFSSRIGVLGHGGFFGVELFFVLSGFLIGKILLRLGDAFGKASTLGVFYARRWFRTLPLFWLFVAVNIVLEGQWHGRRFGIVEILRHIFFLSTFGGNHISFIPESFSLAIEEWFYLLFPAVLWLGRRASLRFITAFLVAAAGFYSFSTIARVLSASRPDVIWSDWQRVIVIYRFDALMTGVAAAWIAQRFPRAWKESARVLAVAGLILTLTMYATLWRPGGAFVVASPDSFFARTFRFNFISLGFALLLPMMSGWTPRMETWWSTSVRRIALWSYAMYLVHQPVIHLWQRYFFPGRSTSLVQAFAAFFTEIGATIAISALLFRFYEAPLTRLRDKAAPPVARWLGRPIAAA